MAVRFRVDRQNLGKVGLNPPNVELIAQLADFASQQTAINAAEDALDAAEGDIATLQASLAALEDSLSIEMASVPEDDEYIRDTIGAALVAGSNVTITVSDAADTITIASTGGSGGAFGEFAQSIPLASAFTLVNGGTGATSSATDYASKGLGLKVVGTTTGRSVMAYQTPPSAPYMMTTRISAFAGMTSALGNEMLAGIALRNSTNGRALVCYMAQDGNIYVQSWSTINAFNATLSTGPGSLYFEPRAAVYFAVYVDGSGNIQFYYSGNGAQWEPFGAATTIAAYLTASGGGSLDQIGLFLGVQAAATRTGYLLCPFFRVDTTSPPALAL